MPSIEDYEKLGSFYLGKKYDLARRELTDEYLNYDSRDLVTHALCVGMTGSGKTGLCISLLEEAAIDNIPVICVDPKGDLGNLLLTFPDLLPEDFEPWIDPSEVSRQGKAIPEIASDVAGRWKKGIEDWGQSADRIKRLKESNDITIYTPGSTVGVPLTVLQSLHAPSKELREDSEAYRDLISSSVSGLLALLGVVADPLTSREHILLSNILDNAWKDGKDLSLEELIRLIQTPPITKVGVIALDTFFPPVDRIKLSMTLNNLLASPAFAGWLDGQSLNIRELLFGKEGRSRTSIISIAHLSDSERMFFVTILLNELVSWMRTQPGTGSLRAIFYMDEVFGYFPPSSNPPSKPPMLTLLKQARAFGLGIVLATQNPVDLDYKGLSNMGTWFLGRLQTQRDKDRVLDGLEGASLQQGASFSRSKMERSLSSLSNRVFLMNNVHDDAPTIFQTRWALSYLRGPLSREQISRLMKAKKEDISNKNAPTSSSSSSTLQGDSGSENATSSGAFGGSDPRANISNGRVAERADSSPSGTRSESIRSLGDGARPIVPNTINERFVVPEFPPSSRARLFYKPVLLADANIHFVRTGAKVDCWEENLYVSDLVRPLPADVWEGLERYSVDQLQLAREPEDGFQFDELPQEILNVRTFNACERALKDTLFRREQRTVYLSKALNKYSPLGMSEMDARIEFRHEARQARDEAVDSARSKLAPKLRSLDTRIAAAQAKLEKEKSSSQAAWVDGLVNLGTSVLGTFMGRKLNTKANLEKATRAAKKLGKANNTRSDVLRAADTVESLMEERYELEQEVELEIQRLTRIYSAENLELEPVRIPIRKSDTRVDLLAIAWIPWQMDAEGISKPLIQLNVDSMSAPESDL